MAARRAPGTLTVLGGVSGAPVPAVPAPRKGHSAKREGKPRGAEKGRPWRVKLYEPSDGYPSYRLAFKDPLTGRWTGRAIPDGADPDEWFDALERQLDEKQHQPARPKKPTMRHLKDRYLDWLRSKNRSENYIGKVDNLLEVWVMRVEVGPKTTAAGLLVERWTAEHSQDWIDAARESLSAARVEELGVALAGMRRTAQRREKGSGLRWMARTENPLEDVSYSRSSTIEGAHRDFIPEDQRPTTDHVESLLAAAETTSPWPWMPTQLRVGAYCGPRLSEQLAIRDVAIDFVECEILIRNTVRWPVPSKGISWGLNPIKTKKWRRVPYPPFLHEALLGLVRTSLGLGPDATLEEVTAAQRKLYDKRLRAIERPGQRTGRDLVSDDHLLFTETPHGVPPTKEKYGEAFRKLRSASTWPGYLPWRNARHHCAGWWMRTVRHPETGEPVGHHVLASWLGHSTNTFRNHYLLVGEDERREA